ncbi:MAG TPA: YgiT-type zinc finger protein [Bryobacteraceae bacterium]|nr:YgiT-type zinc finger protein [Bryobacteraceae bacterium]
MTCDVCAIGERRRQLIRYHVEVDGKLIVVDNVPAIVCDHCGEVSIEPRVATNVQHTVWGGKPPARSLETPVYEYGA